MRRRKRNQQARGILVERTNLTSAERKLLADPNVVTEDDADFITFKRREAEASTPVRKLIRKYGVTVEK